MHKSDYFVNCTKALVYCTLVVQTWFICTVVQRHNGIPKFAVGTPCSKENLANFAKIKETIQKNQEKRSRIIKALEKLK